MVGLCGSLAHLNANQSSKVEMRRSPCKLLCVSENKNHTVIINLLVVVMASKLDNAQSLDKEID